MCSKIDVFYEEGMNGLQASQKKNQANRISIVPCEVGCIRIVELVCVGREELFWSYHFFY
jgi:hypothetical protein